MVEPQITTTTVRSILDPDAVVRLKKREDERRAALTPEQRALEDAVSAEVTRRFLFGDAR